MTIKNNDKKLSKVLAPFLLCAIIFLSEAHAAPLQKKVSLPQIQLNPATQLQIEPKNTTKESTSLVIDFDQMKPLNGFEVIDKKILTIYQGKQNTLKATYLQGSYAINYSQNW